MLFSRFTPSRILISGMVFALAATTAWADETRHCNAELKFSPQNASQTYLVYNFSVRKTVDLLAQVNRARREARDQIVACVRDHWAERFTGTRPRFCTNQYRTEFVNYPFTSLDAELTEALCAANPGVGSMLVTVDLNISGNTGCTYNGSHVQVAQNVRIDCAEPITDGGSDEAHEDPPVIGDGGSWECVGEGCDGSDAAEDEPPADPGPPASASYRLLPIFRLPGNDLYMLGAGDGIGDWMDCRQACTADPACGAWTYRAPTNRCLIKRGAGLPIPDPCCHSGIKN